MLTPEHHLGMFLAGGAVLVLLGTGILLWMLRRAPDNAPDWWRAPAAPPPPWGLADCVLLAVFFYALLVVTKLIVRPGELEEGLQLYFCAQAVLLVLMGWILQKRGATRVSLGLNAGRMLYQDPPKALRWYVMFFPIFFAMMLLGKAGLTFAEDWLHLPKVDRDPELLRLFQSGDISPGMILYLSAYAVIGAPLVEEFFFRGFFYGALRHHLSWQAAALVSGLCFGVLHMDWLRVLPLSAFGVYLAILRERTGSLSIPILVHAINNAFVLVLMYLMLGTL